MLDVIPENSVVSLGGINKQKYVIGQRLTPVNFMIAIMLLEGVRFLADSIIDPYFCEDDISAFVTVTLDFLHRHVIFWALLK